MFFKPPVNRHLCLLVKVPIPVMHENLHLPAVARSKGMEEKREQGSFKQTTTGCCKESGHHSRNSLELLGEYFLPRTPTRVAEIRPLT